MQAASAIATSGLTVRRPPATSTGRRYGCDVLTSIGRPLILGLTADSTTINGRAGIANASIPWRANAASPLTRAQWPSSLMIPATTWIVSSGSLARRYRP